VLKTGELDKNRQSFPHIALPLLIIFITCSNQTFSMKQLFTIALLLVQTWGLQAQSFGVTPNPSSVIASPNDTDVENHNDLNNKGPFAKTMRWTRTEVFLSDPSLETQICDNIACYLPSVSTRTFPLAGNETISIIVHMLNPNSLPAQAIVHLKFSNENVPTDTLTAVYLFDATVSANDPVGNASIKVFPNPTTDYFQLQGADEVTEVRMYSLDGRLVMQRNATPDQRYRLNNFTPAAFVVALVNAQGKIIQATELQVK
jgi:hypothetical protein